MPGRRSTTRGRGRLLRCSPTALSLSLRDDDPDGLQLESVGGAAALALSSFLIGVNRQRVLASRSLPQRISPRRALISPAGRFLALILISALSLAL